MEKNAQEYVAFMEGVCEKLGCKEVLPSLKEGFSLYLEAAFSNTGDLLRNEADSYEMKYKLFNVPVDQLKNPNEITLSDIAQRLESGDIKLWSKDGDGDRRESVAWLKSKKDYYKDETDKIVLADTPTMYVVAFYVDDARRKYYDVHAFKLDKTRVAGASVENDPEWNMKPAERAENRTERYNRTSYAAEKNRKLIPEELVKKIETFAQNMGWNAYHSMDVRDGDEGFVFTTVVASNATGPDDTDVDMIDSLMTKLNFTKVLDHRSDPHGIDQTETRTIGYAYVPTRMRLGDHEIADDFYNERRAHPGDPNLQNFDRYNDKRSEERSNSFGWFL